MKMLNEDISGHLPLKIDVIPAVMIDFCPLSIIELDLHETYFKFMYFDLRSPKNEKKIKNITDSLALFSSDNTIRVWSSNVMLGCLWSMLQVAYESDKLLFQHNMQHTKQHVRYPRR